MRILYVCADPGVPLRGVKGASVHVRAITAALARVGHDVTLAIATEGAGNVPPDLRRIVLLAPNATAAAAQLGELLESDPIDLVVERYSLHSGAAAAAAHAHGAVLLLEMNAPLAHEAARYRGLGDLSAALEHERDVLTSADLIQVVSPALERYVRRVVPDAQVHVVPNGVESARFATAAPAWLPGAAGGPVIGFVGSMKPWHGLHDLIEAFALVPPRAPPPRLLFVGTGPEEESVRSRASVPALAGRVLMLGAVTHAAVPGVVRAIDIAVAPYTSIDDFYFSPLKIFEYMAAGRPLVYPDVGDLGALVGDAGLSYPPGDVTALAARLTQLIDDAPLRQRLGVSAAVRAAAHDWHDVARRIVALAGPMVAARPRTTRAPARPM